MFGCHYHRLWLPWIVQRERIRGIHSSASSSAKVQDIFDYFGRESEEKEEHTSSSTNYESDKDVPAIAMAGTAVQGTCPGKALVNSKTC